MENITVGKVEKPRRSFNTTTKTEKLQTYLKQLLIDIKRDKYLYLLMVPCLLFFYFFAYRPMYGLQIAFKDYSLFKGIEASQWVGLDNFITFFNSPYAWRLIKNTLVINLYSIILGFPMPIIIALLFNEVRHKKFKSIGQTITYLPHFISVVIVAGMVVNFMAPSGIINNLLEMLGMDRTYFLTQAEYFRGIFTSMNIWKESGFAAVIYISALSGVDQQLYEAAEIDGANRWQQLKNITIPSIMPTIVIMFILRIGRLLTLGFESVLLLQQPATYETSDVISTYVYRLALTNGSYDIAAAVDLLNAFISLVLVFTANKLTKKFSETSLW